MTYKYPASSGGGGAESFTELSDAPNSFAGKAGQAIAVNAAEDALSTVHRASPYCFKSWSGAGGAYALPAADFGRAYMTYLTLSAGGVPLEVTLPDAADVLAANPWIAEAPGLTDGDVVGFTIRVFNANNVGTGEVSFVNGDGVSYFAYNIKEKEWNDLFVNVIYNDPETPLTLEVYAAGGMSDANL